MGQLNVSRDALLPPQLGSAHGKFAQKREPRLHRYTVHWVRAVQVGNMKTKKK